MLKTLTLAATLLVAALALAGCADDSLGSPSSEANTSAEASPGTSTSAEPSPSTSTSVEPAAGTSIDITIKNGKVSPNGERVEAKIGETVTLHIDADTAGELHVHATPEQEIEFPRGVSTKTLTIDRPGVVDVEDHELEQVVVQLQVS